MREAQTRVEALVAERERLARETETLTRSAADRADEAAQVAERLRGLDRPIADPAAVADERARLETQLVAARETIAQAQAAERAIAAEIAGARERVATLTAQRDAARSRIELLGVDGERAAAARERMTAELASLDEALDASAIERARLQGEIESANARMAVAVRERDGVQGHAQQVDADARLARAAEREASTQGEKTRVRLAEIDAELGMLAAQFAQNPATAEECAELEARYAGETGDFTPELARLRDELGRLSNVNLNAEAEIEELVERERFLSEQLEDLARARETLLASIGEIEASSQAQFNETFALVKVAFEDVYARLFPGGEARMWQTDSEHLSETGIEISVQPPGKKMMPLTTLSGGERAMAASALIFALIRVKPSPFYLLDEVDAALDDANVERFSQLVRDVGEKAQLLIVTHNKKTMELAQRLYGVTMREPGISSVVTADLLPEADDAGARRESVVVA